MEIKRLFKNKMNGGYSAFFEHKNKYYFADIAWTFDCGNECMIFSAAENENVTSWSELYCNRRLFVSEYYLMKCIKEFCSDLDEKEKTNEQ